VVAQQAGRPADWGLLLGAGVASSLRVLALLTGFTLPRWSSGGDDDA
jgi:hypothetical protein